MYSKFTVFSEIFAVGWIFVLGASIGSFLNVLVYRLPRGKTILGGSFCPKCREEILFRDNIPIFGWILLKGQCRVCRLPISSRYPIVECICGAMLLAIAIPELAFGGINFPGIAPPRYFGFSWNLLDLPENLIVVYAGHAILACCLLVATLIEWDREFIPRSLTFAVLLIALFITCANPQLVDGSTRKIAKLATSLTAHDLSLRGLGALIGAFAGSLVGRCDRISRRRFAFAWIATAWWSAIGWCLGGSAMMSLFVISAVFSVFLRPLHRKVTIPPPALDDPQYAEKSAVVITRGTWISRIAAAPMGLLLLSFLFHILFWGLLSHMPGWPTAFDRFPATGLWLITGLIAYGVTFLVDGRQSAVRQVCDRAL